jgi:hypothetical protein
VIEFLVVYEIALSMTRSITGIEILHGTNYFPSQIEERILIQVDTFLGCEDIFIICAALLALHPQSNCIAFHPNQTKVLFF